MVEVLNQPPPEAVVLPSSRRFFYWIALNRVRIGMVAMALLAYARVAIDFKGHDEAYRALEILIELGLLGSAVTTGAGAFKSTSFHEREMHAEIRHASGQWPAYQRRATDNAKASPDSEGSPPSRDLVDKLESHAPYPYSRPPKTRP